MDDKSPKNSQVVGGTVSWADSFAAPAARSTVKTLTCLLKPVTRSKSNGGRHGPPKADPRVLGATTRPYRCLGLGREKC
jgi:hypothetical protein